MKHDRKRVLSLAIVGLLLLLAGVATATDIALKNWKPAAMSVAPGPSPLLSDLGNPLIFVPVTPCRIIDTRGGAPFVGGAFAASASRDYQFSSSAAPCNGLPTGARGFSINVTVTSTAGPGFLSIYPRGAPPSPLVSTINYAAGDTIANAASVPTDGSGYITILCGVSGTHVIVDVNGYYIGGGIGAVLNSGEFLGFAGTYDGGGLFYVHNNSTSTSTSTTSIRGQINSGVNNQSGVWGEQQSGTGVNYGVKGTNASTSDGAAGVYGEASGATGRTFGVLGTSASTTGQSYGVVGIAGGATFAPNNSFKAGGRFVGWPGSSYGAVGEGQTGGFIGFRVNSTGLWQTYGAVGYLGSDGLFSNNNLTALGTKSFAEPLATDPSRVVKYVCAEGPESGTYFRGRGRFVNRTAVIDVPEHFRIVTDEEGLTVQITPIGRAASVGVVRIGLDQIEVESTRDVEFSYLVQGVRRAYKDWQPVQNATATENPYFIPVSASHKLEASWPQEIRQRLISNGTYNADGTVNMQTAERMGWAQKWRDEEAATAERAREAQAASSGKGENGQ